ncbi:MAG: FliA/WhiG family RNA polymerase sigma factor [Myxococcales bacterium]|nr:MAG: FliA/WhiG family RNA polymerase sigma factor [Myxococcales bacterium]
MARTDIPPANTMVEAQVNWEIVERRATRAEREKLILEYAPLVKRIAYRIVSRLPDTIHVEDLISIGTIGLIDAVEKYNPEKGKGFKAYAELRIKGAILDELRGYDNLSRANRRRANELEQTRLDLESRLGRAPTEEEVCRVLGVEIDDLHALRSNTRSLVFLDIDDVSYQGEVEPEAQKAAAMHEDFEPYRLLADKALKDQLSQAIQKLPEQLKLVLSLYYFSELNYKEIGEVLNLSESRISQLHTKAVLKMRKIMQALE